MKPLRYQQEPVLRPRLKQVLLMLAYGHKAPYIAYKLGIALKTVQSYASDLRQIYGLGNTDTEIVENAIARGLIPSGEEKQRERDAKS